MSVAEREKKEKIEENRFLFETYTNTHYSHITLNVQFFLFSSAHHRERQRNRVSSSVEGSKQFSGRDFVCLRDVTLLKSPSALRLSLLCICEAAAVLSSPSFLFWFRRLNKKHTVIHQWSSALTQSRAALSAGLDFILRLIFTGSMVTCLLRLHADFSRAYLPCVCLGNSAAA